jgi:peptidoglycan/xylan/chitin deacetylase (PgdA/CDA1 family)
MLLVLLLAGCPRAVPENGHVTPAGAAKAEQQLAAASRVRAPSLAPVEAELIAHGPRTERRLALTFDACTTRNVSQYDARITQELTAASAKATIFLGGGWAREEAAHVRELAASPLFELGNHSYTHPHMTGIASGVRLEEELVKTQSEVFELTGRTPRLFRPPYGEYNDRLVRAAAKVGLTTVEYDLPSGDPDEHATKERLVEWVLRQARPGSIIVMHVNHVKFHTAEALPAIIRGLRDAGFELVTVGELLREEHALSLDAGAAP